MNRKINQGLAIFFCFLFFLGCAHRANHKAKPSKMQEVSQLQFNLKKLETQIDDLEHQVLVLQDKVNQYEKEPNFSKNIRSGKQKIPVVRISSGEEIIGDSTSMSRPDPERKYKDLYYQFNSGDCQETVLGFDKFAKTYPDSSYADNAQYWIGECFYRIQEFRLAIDEFKKVEEKYPKGNKVPDSWLRLGMAKAALGESSQAMDYYQKVVHHYPKSEAADKALKLLAGIPNQGGS